MYCHFQHCRSCRELERMWNRQQFSFALTTLYISQCSGKCTEVRLAAKYKAYICQRWDLYGNSESPVCIPPCRCVWGKAGFCHYSSNPECSILHKPSSWMKAKWDSGWENLAFQKVAPSLGTSQSFHTLSGRQFCVDAALMSHAKDKHRAMCLSCLERCRSTAVLLSHWWLLSLACQ